MTRLAPAPRLPQRRKAWAVAIAALLGCVLFTRLAWAVRDAREAARRSHCVCNLCSVRVALWSYHDTYGSLPPAYVAGPDGRPWHSWRTLVLEFMDPALHERYRFDQPWDAPANRAVLDARPNCLDCPSRQAPSTLTSYAAITGPGTAFPGATPAKFSDLTDGRENTLLVVEVANLAIPWTSPRDLALATMSPRVNDPTRPGISSRHPGGANVVFADGHYGFLLDSTPPAALKALATGAGGEVVDAARVLSGK